MQLLRVKGLVRCKVSEHIHVCICLMQQSFHISFWRNIQISSLPCCNLSLQPIPPVHFFVLDGCDQRALVSNLIGNVAVRLWLQVASAQISVGTARTLWGDAFQALAIVCKAELKRHWMGMIPFVRRRNMGQRAANLITPMRKEMWGKWKARERGREGKDSGRRRERRAHLGGVPGWFESLRNKRVALDGLDLLYPPHLLGERDLLCKGGKKRKERHEGRGKVKQTRTGEKSIRDNLINVNLLHLLLYQ